MTLSLVLLSAALFTASPIAAEQVKPKPRDWQWQGAFGSFDYAAINRGLQVYLQVCSVCHSLEYVHYRDLADLGLTKKEINVIAADYQVGDGPNDNGEMFERPARANDKFVSPFANEKAARVANNGALPPDLSLITKARTDGVDYLSALLQGYTDPPKGFKLGDGLFYNRYFDGEQIAMPPPLVDDIIEYGDGTPATMQQLAEDVTAFLAWTAEPHLVARKRLGFKVLGFLLIVVSLLGLIKRRIEKQVKG